MAHLIKVWHSLFKEIKVLEPFKPTDCFYQNICSTGSLINMFLNEDCLGFSQILFGLFYLPEFSHSDLSRQTIFKNIFHYKKKLEYIY